MSRLLIDIEWLNDPGAEIAFGPERDTWAKFALSIDGDYLTWHVPADLPPSRERGKSHVIGGLSGLAEWVVENWQYVTWEVRTPFPRAEPLSLAGKRPAIPGLRDAATGWTEFAIDETEANRLAGWQHRHTLGHGCSPIALPSIVLLPEVRHVLVAVDGPPTGTASDVRFQQTDQGWPSLYAVQKDDLQDVLESLVDQVIARASAVDRSRHWAGWLGGKWAGAKQLAEDPDFRRRNLLGEWLADRWNQVEREHGEAAKPLQGVAVDSFPIDSDETLDRLIGHFEQVTSGKVRGRGGWERLISGALDTTRPLYEQGYRLARHVRDVLHRPSEPLVNLRGLLAQLEIDTTDPEPIYGFRTALVARRAGNAKIIQSSADPRMESVVGSRFALAAALGRLIASASGNGSVALGAAHGECSRILETRRANSFAAEFLLPVKALRERASDSSIESIIDSELCEQYGISRQAASWHAWNHGFKARTVG